MSDSISAIAQWDRPPGWVVTLAERAAGQWWRGELQACSHVPDPDPQGRQIVFFDYSDAMLRCQPCLWRAVLGPALFDDVTTRRPGPAILRQRRCEVCLEPATGLALEAAAHPPVPQLALLVSVCDDHGPGEPG